MNKSLQVEKAHDVCERLYISVHALAVGKGDVRQRLGEMAVTLLPLRVEDFPIELQPEYESISNVLLKYTSQHDNETAVEATCKHMKNATGSAIAERIFELYCKSLILAYLVDLSARYKYLTNKNIGDSVNAH